MSVCLRTTIPVQCLYREAASVAKPTKLNIPRHVWKHVIREITYSDSVVLIKLDLILITYILKWRELNGKFLDP